MRTWRPSPWMLHQLAVEQRLRERRLRAAPPGRVVARAVDVEEAQDRDLQALLLGAARARRARRRAWRPRRPSGRVVGGPSTRRRPRRTGGVALPYTSEVEAMTTGTSSASATSQAACAPSTLACSVSQGAAVARDLHPRRGARSRRSRRRRARSSRWSRQSALWKRKLGSARKPVDVAGRAVRQVVDADDLAAFVEQALAQVGADEAGGAGHADSFGVMGPSFARRRGTRGSVPAPRNTAVRRKFVRSQRGEPAVVGLAEGARGRTRSRACGR